MMKNTKQRGFSLIEILIALVISALLLSSAVSMLISNKQTYRQQDQSGRLQENARYAIERLIADIRMAGYFGCADDPNTISAEGLGSGPPSLLNVDIPIEGMDGGSSGTPPLPLPDEITIRRAQGGGMELAENSLTAPLMTTTTSDIYLDVGNFTQPTNCPTQPTLGILCVATVHSLVISDCQGADVFYGSNATYGTAVRIKPDNALSRLYTDRSTLLSHLITRRFFIDDTSGTSVLYMESSPSVPGTHNENELVEGVVNMQLLYGVDTSANGMVDSYVDASAVTDWAQVLSVRIMLGLLPVERDYAFEEPTPSNFQTTVKIRNRGI